MNNKTKINMKLLCLLDLCFTFFRKVRKTGRHILQLVASYSKTSNVNINIGIEKCLKQRAKKKNPCNEHSSNNDVLFAPK